MNVFAMEGKLDRFRGNRLLVCFPLLPAPTPSSVGTFDLTIVMIIHQLIQPCHSQYITLQRELARIDCTGERGESDNAPHRDPSKSRINNLPQGPIGKLRPCFSLLARIATSCVGTFDLSIVILMLQTFFGPEGFCRSCKRLFRSRDVGIG